MDCFTGREGNASTTMMKMDDLEVGRRFGWKEDGN
jgi:hypothetical protein